MTLMLEEKTVKSSHRAQRPGRVKDRPPVILLGGRANALSVARSIGRLGAAVYALNAPGAFVGYSRYCRQIEVTPPPGQSEVDAWAQFLLGSASDSLRGSIILACGDDGIELLLKHREALLRKYTLDEANPAASRMMLNKLATYQAAVEAGVPTPRFWIADSPEQLEEVRGQLVFPLIVKPLLSHVFEASSGKKLVIAERFEQVAAAVDAITQTGVGCVLMEMIPGPDDRLCSYFTYLDENSQPLFHFTKRIIRRYPVLMGTACYHITDWIPELAELGPRLFKHVGLRGLANVEFKFDPRDGQYKLIECNARFTASDCLVSAAGVDLGAFVYNRLTGRPNARIVSFHTGLRLWDPARDFQCGRFLARQGKLRFGQWLSSVLHRQTFAYFTWSDPLPALARLTLPLRKRLGLAGRKGKS